MEKSIVATGKTIDAAVESALKQLKLDRDSVSVEVIENPKNGFLGIIGVAPARIKVTYEAPDEPACPAAPAPAMSSASRTTAPVRPTAVPAPVKKPETPAPRPTSAPKPAEAPAPRPASAPKPAEAPKPIAPPAEPGTTEARIEEFLTGLLQRMDSDAVPRAARESDDVFCAELTGTHLGMLIGRRGDTLDAIQHLTNYAVNRGAAHRVRISVDAENYRRKREEALKRLAEKVAGKVVQFRKNITLEPMNAYERHVIHAALQEYPDVTTYSTGTEPNRRVVVAYSKYKSVGTNAQS